MLVMSTMTTDIRKVCKGIGNNVDYKKKVNVAFTSNHPQMCITWNIVILNQNYTPFGLNSVKLCLETNYIQSLADLTLRVAKISSFNFGSMFEESNLFFQLRF